MVERQEVEPIIKALASQKHIPGNAPPACPICAALKR